MSEDQVTPAETAAQVEPVAPATDRRAEDRFRARIFWLPICIIVPVRVIFALMERGMMEASGGDKHVFTDSMIRLSMTQPMQVLLWILVLAGMAWLTAVVVFVYDVFRRRWVWRNLLLLVAGLLCYLLL